MAERMDNNNEGGGGVMKLRLKARDLIECVAADKYAELSQKYGLDAEALEGLRISLRKGNWKPLIRGV